MQFAGFGERLVDFYDGLEADNSKAYWTDHRAVYENDVKAPMLALLAACEAEFGPGKIFRPYRDVRFSADKTPYKTAMGATLSAGGYVHLSAEGLGAGTGMYHMANDQLDRYRRGVADDETGVPLASLVKKLGKSGIEVAAHDELKRAPKGYPADHPRIELLRLKGLIAWKQWPAAAWLGTKAAKTRVLDFLHTAQPLNDWLAEHVGPSTLPVDEGRGRR